MRLITPAYASPEQFRGEPATVRSDLYSLGAGAVGTDLRTAFAARRRSALLRFAGDRAGRRVPFPDSQCAKRGAEGGAGRSSRTL